LTKTLVILGSHPGTRNEFDFTREDCEIWVFNEAMSQGWCKRADRVFQIHDPIIWRNPVNRNDPKHYEWLKSGDTPTIVMQEVYDDVPKSTAYPLEAVKQLGASGKHLLSSSIAEAIAMAIQEGYQKIEIYGVEMETDTEYRYQRDGVSYWIGFAEGRGIEVDWHSKTYKYPIYGYEGDIHLDYQRDFVDRLMEIAPALEVANQQYSAHVELVSKAIEQSAKTGVVPDGFETLVKEQINLGVAVGLVDGMRQEVERYKAKADTMIEATGSFIFSRQEFEKSAQALAQAHAKAVSDTQAAGGRASAALNYALETRNKMKRAKRFEAFAGLLQVYIQEATKAGIYDGATRENIRLIQRLDALIRAAGGEKSYEVMIAAESVEA